MATLTAQASGYAKASEPAKISVIGAGYVGLVSAACFADFGHNVVAFDVDKQKIERLRRGETPIYEPGLELVIQRNVASHRLSFVDDLDKAMHEADVVFIAVGTPARPEDGHADLRFVFEAADAIGVRLHQPTVVVCKSTVPVGTNREVLRRLRNAAKDTAVEVASNPEFLREGSAFKDFMRPDRIVVGAESEFARDRLRAVYAPLTLNGTPVLFTDLESAELIKYASNSFLATKITFINELADLCERVGGDIQDVARGVGMDARIGPKFLQAGPGFGGSCFPKDMSALAHTARQAGIEMPIIDAVIRTNTHRKVRIARRIADALGGSVAGRTIAVLGVAFKPNTDDVRDAPSLAIVPALQADGAIVRAHDPEAMNEAAKHLTHVEWCEGPYHAAEGADALVLLTEWDAYQGLDFARLARLMKGRAFIDLRNLYQPETVGAAGFEYAGIGRRAGGDGARSRRVIPNLHVMVLCSKGESDATSVR